MSDSRFSGQPNPKLSGNDPFGYFGGQPAGTSGASPFGGPPSPGPGTGAHPAPPSGTAPYGGPPPPAQTPYGTAPQFGATPFGAAPFGAAPSGQPFQQPAPAPSRGLNRSGLFIAVAAVLVIVVGFGGWTLYQRYTQGLNVPVSLAGMARDTEPASVTSMQQLRTQLSNIPNDGVTKVEVQAYGSSVVRHIAVLVLARADQTINIPSVQAGLYSRAVWTPPAPVGSSTCATSSNGVIAMCFKVDGNLMTVVLDGGLGATPAAAAAMVDEARAQQP